MSRSVRTDYDTLRERQARAQEPIVTAPDEDYTQIIPNFIAGLTAPIPDRTERRRMARAERNQR